MPLRKWGQEDIDTLQEMLDEYRYAKRLGKTFRRAFIWAFGIPAFCLWFWDSIEKFLVVMAKLFGRA